MNSPCFSALLMKCLMMGTARKNGNGGEHCDLSNLSNEFACSFKDGVL